MNKKTERIKQAVIVKNLIEGANLVDLPQNSSLNNELIQAAC